MSSNFPADRIMSEDVDVIFDMMLKGRVCRDGVELKGVDCFGHMSHQDSAYQKLAEAVDKKEWGNRTLYVCKVVGKVKDSPSSPIRLTGVDRFFYHIHGTAIVHRNKTRDEFDK